MQHEGIRQAEIIRSKLTTLSRSARPSPVAVHSWSRGVLCAGNSDADQRGAKRRLPCYCNCKPSQAFLACTFNSFKFQEEPQAQSGTPRADSEWTVDSRQ